VLLLAGAAAARVADREALAAVGVAGVAVVAAWASAATQPKGGAFGLVVGNYRWLWPVSLFVLAAVALALVRAVAPRRPLVPVVAAAVAAGLAAAALVPAQRIPVTADDEPLLPVARRLAGSLDGLVGTEPVAVARGRLHFGEPYTYVLLAGLQDAGVDFDVLDDRDLRRFGSGRRARPGTAIVTLRGGDDALTVPAGWERVAFVSGLTRAERAELDRLRRDGPSDRLEELERRWQRETVAVVLQRGD
jgi:hypothetical protein